MQFYGSADLGNIAYESEALEGMILDEELILEIVRPGSGDPVAPGEVGEIVVTTLNPEYPLIRFATGDLSAVLPGISPCGRTNTRIKGWLGRADQTTKVRGMFVQPGHIDAVAKRHPEILKARPGGRRRNGERPHDPESGSGRPGPDARPSPKPSPPPSATSPSCAATVQLSVPAPGQRTPQRRQGDRGTPGSTRLAGRPALIVAASAQIPYREARMTAETFSTRCCIAGGGPAGMVLGFLLARAGIDVTVLEKHADFLRDFRGDTIHPSTLEVMHELGLLEKFLQRPCIPEGAPSSK